MDLECFFSYLITQQMVPTPPWRGDVHIYGGPSTPALIISLGGERVLEVKAKDGEIFSTRLAAGDVYVTTPSAFKHAAVHEGSTRNLDNGMAVVVVLRSHVFKACRSTIMRIPPQPKNLLALACQTFAQRLLSDVFVLPSLSDVMCVV